MKHLPLDFWSAFNKQLARPGFMLLGEQLDGDPSVVTRTWTQGGFTAMFDFPLAFAISDVFCRGQSPAKLAAVLTNDRFYPDASTLVTLVDNHDLPRIVSVCKGDQAKVREALTFLLTARGVPSIIWGTEIGAEGEKEPDTRKSMRFVEHPSRELIAKWLAARRERPSLADGLTAVLQVSDDRAAFARVTRGEATLVYVNHGATPMPPVRLEGEGKGNEDPVPPGIVVRTVRGEFSALHQRLARAPAKRQVLFEGPANARLVGSGPELGDWNPAKSVALPATIDLPVGGAFEFKLVTRTATGVRWEQGANRLLHVQPGADAHRVELRWRD